MASSPPTATPNGKTLTLDSCRLYVTALNPLSSHTSTPDPSLSFHPIPSTFPLSKLIPNTRFLVDAFRFPSSSNFSASFFLSHFHSDHYAGLSASWSKGIIFCSHITSRLLIDVLQVSSPFIFSLPLQQPVVIDGCEVTLVDANHCPGAVQFLFKVPLKNGGFERYVHTGDFRFSESMKSDTCLSGFVGCDAIFLDTTYCNPKFVFPLQQESIDYVVSVIDRIGGEFSAMRKRVLFLVATYVVGKEKILTEVARRCKRKIHVDARKMAVFRVLGYGDGEIFTEDERESDVHVVGWNVLGETWPYFRPNFVRMKDIMVEKGYEKVVGFVPTGWTYEVKRNKFAVRCKDSYEIHLVPYSEHSNYDELREYVKYLKPKRVIPTVGMDAENIDSKHAIKMRKHFVGLVDEMANKKDFLMGFYLKSCEHGEKAEMNASIGLNEPDQEKGSSFEAPTIEKNDPGDTLDDTILSVEPSLRVSTLQVNDEETEKIIGELRNCLPTWVTQEQILDLIGKSGRNIVEVASNFYEHETLFYEQVFACSTSGAASQTILLNETVPLLKPASVENSPHKRVGIHLSQVCKSLNIKTSVKSSISPGKRKNIVDNKPNKKIKSSTKLESSGPKQSTITRFFSKQLPNQFHTDEGGSKTKECVTDEYPVPNDATVQYKEEIDQFIGILNGNESLRSYAASILQKTKGDINVALDIYYCNPEDNIGENAERLAISIGSAQVQHFANCSFPLKNVSQHMDNSSKPNSTREHVNTTLVSLPPEKYKPIEHACWRDGEPAPYIHLARTFDLVEGEKGKIRATSMLCNMFRSLLALSPEDVLPAVYLCTNKIASDHENIELNIGGSLVTTALEEACGTNRSKLRDMYNDLGDLGDVAQVCRQRQMLLAPPPPLLIREVFSTLRKISAQTGSQSTSRKKNLIINLMRSCREKEIKFLVRTLVRNLRIGAMMRTVLPALAQAVVMNLSLNSQLEEKTEDLKEKLQGLSVAVVEAYNILPNLDLLVPSIIEKGVGFSSTTLSMVPGIPIKPMLAKIANGVPQALKLFQSKAFTCEYKYDGQRAQIHKLVDGTVHVFSRNGDETTSRFPDLVDTVNKFSKPAAETFILDAEVVAVDRRNGCKIMSFQELSSRGRGSRDSLIAVGSIKVDICVFLFDVMFANGEQYVPWILPGSILALLAN